MDQRDRGGNWSDVLQEELNRFLALKMEKRGHRPKNVGSLQQLQKTEKQILPQSLQGSAAV